MRGFSIFRPFTVLPILASVIALTASLQSCAPPEDDSVTSACTLPTDQRNTLTGRWRSSPIYVSFSTAQFNTYEMGLIMDAADIWNRFYGSAHGFDIIDYGTRTEPRTNSRTKPAGGLCSTTLLNSSGGFAGSVIIYKDTVWPSTYAASAIALTSTCASTGSTATVAPMYTAMMELNFQNFFVTGKQMPDLTSIFVHEFGHLLGLDHSCAQSGTSSPKPPLCSNSNLDISYYEAVMYPTVNFKADGTSYPRRSLNANDQGRANCLYGDNAL